MQEGTREVHATGLLFDLEDAVLARPARSVPGHRWARRRRIWRRSLGGVVGSAAGPAERGGGGGTAGAAADRPGRLHRRGVLPGAGQTVLASGDFLSDRALLADPATTALRRERTAECVQICGSVAVLGRGRSGSGDQGRGDQPGAAAGLGGGDGRRW